MMHSSIIASNVLNSNSVVLNLFSLKATLYKFSDKFVN